MTESDDINCSGIPKYNPDDKKNMTNVPNVPRGGCPSWIKYICTALIIVAISGAFMAWELAQKPTIGECDKLAQDALDFANTSSYMFAADRDGQCNYTCVTPDVLNKLNTYLNLTQNYYRCMQGVY